MVGVAVGVAVVVGVAVGVAVVVAVAVGVAVGVVVGVAVGVVVGVAVVNNLFIVMSNSSSKKTKWAPLPESPVMPTDIVDYLTNPDKYKHLKVEVFSHVPQKRGIKKKRV